MLLFISGWLIFFLLHLSSNECSLIDSDNYREAYFKLEIITDGKDDHLFNSNAEISCMLDCLSDVNCSKGVFNKSSQSCIASSKPEERGDDVEIWERLPNEMKSTTMPNKVKEPKIYANSCLQIKRIKPDAQSGVFKINLQSNETVDMFCDMETDSGGWTLVWVYTFTQYSQFSDRSNAVTPIPDWPASDANVAYSRIPPLNESSVGALKFSQWKLLGNDFLIKSSINHWISCTSGTGSLVEWISGSIQCKNVRNITSVCQGTAPDTIQTDNPKGPLLKISSEDRYYFFDGDTTKSTPIHDPCGRGEYNQKNGVTKPRGGLFIR